MIKLHVSLKAYVTEFY